MYYRVIFIDKRTEGGCMIMGFVLFRCLSLFTVSIIKINCLYSNIDKMTSLFFRGVESSYLLVPNTDAFDFGTGDFTIEWYQYQTDSNPFPRIFQVGNYTSGISIGVSIEGGNFYYWRNGTYTNASYIASSNYKNRWAHFAISRFSGVTKIFMNGLTISTINDTTNFNGVNDLIISNESTPAISSAFGGYITYFTWVKGTALYTSNFTVSDSYPELTEKHILLLYPGGFYGTLGNTVVNNNVLSAPVVPPGFQGVHTMGGGGGTVIRRQNRPLFSNNAMVFYKRGSLPSGGVGSVRNSSIKSKRT